MEETDSPTIQKSTPRTNIACGDIILSIASPRPSKVPRFHLPMTPAEILREIVGLLFFDVRRGDHHVPKRAHYHHYPDLTSGLELPFPRFALIDSASASLAGSQANSFALQKDPHFSRGNILSLVDRTDQEPWSSRHTLLWRLSFAPAAHNKLEAHRNVTPPSDGTSSPSALQSSPSTTKRIPTRKAREPLSSTLLTRLSPYMCKWNPNSKHPIPSRRCAHWNFRHERLSVIDRPVAVVWCNKCWTVCAFESNEPIHSVWTAWFFRLFQKPSECAETPVEPFYSYPSLPDGNDVHAASFSDTSDQALEGQEVRISGDE